MYHVSAQGVDERMINVHYYYYYSNWLPDQNHQKKGSENKQTNKQTNDQSMPYYS